MTMAVTIVPIEHQYLEQLQAAVDSVSRERRFLIKATIEAARAKGVTRVELETFASNPRAIHVFELLGFSTEGIKRRARVLDDQEDDLVCMALLLN